MIIDKNIFTRPRTLSKKSADSSSRVGGFTLLETLIALTILAMALTTLMQTYSSGLRTIRISENYLLAREVAQSLLAETRMDRNISVGRESGKNGIFGWNVEITPANQEWAELSLEHKWMLYEISVSVHWATDRQLELQTLLMGPKS